jgi:hypothetical protein
MPITTGQLSVGTSAVAVNVPNVNPLRVHIHNNDNTSNLIVGNANVTASNGLALPKLDSLDITLNPNEVLYVLASSGSIAVSYLVQTEY